MYSLRHQVATYTKFGHLCPTCILEVAPGDTFSGKVGMLVRLSPLKRALLHDIFVDQYMFYVPHRLVMAEWEDFIAQGPVQGSAILIPGSQPAPGSDETDCLFQPAHPTDVTTYTGLRLFAYNLIYNEFFRDFDDPIRAPGAFPGAIGEPVSAKKDYWSMLREAIGFVEPDQFIDTDAGDGTQVSSTQVLEMIARQKIAMKRATYGTRYIDVLRSYGINVNYQMLQRPEVVGVARGSINVTDVVQTAPAAGGGDDALGTLAGHGISGTALSLRRKSFPEHGTLMGFAVIRPVHADIAFTDYMDQRRPYESFYDPGLVPLPPVAITQQDMIGPSDTSITGIVGYQPWGEWYRGALSRIHPGMEEWTGGFGINPDIQETSSSVRRYFGEVSAQFDQLFTNTDFGHCQISAVNSLRAARLIPRNNIMKSQTL